MPYALRRLPRTGLYRVYNRATGTVHAKGTTLGRARRQIRLLERLDREAKT